MLERYLHALSLQDAGSEDPSVTRERLKERFARGATRRMTQLGMLVSVAVDEISPRSDDTIVYASEFAETRALEAYLDSFPSASPTLFQTSIHPSAVQQGLIGRQHAVGEFFPLTGRAHLVAHALQTALLAPSPRVVLCGGEERGTWLLERHMASSQSFAFAAALGPEAAGALARITLTPSPAGDAAVEFTLSQFFQALVHRTPIDCVAAPGLHLSLAWL